RLTDGQGRVVNFKNTLIIMTSNIGSQKILDDPSLSEETKVEVLDTLKANFRPEFINRVDEIIIFKSLGLDAIKDIVLQLLKGVQEKLKERYVTLEFSEPVVEYLAINAYDPQYGARPLRRFIQRELETSIAKMILKNEIKERDHVVAEMSDGKIIFKVK
ncbi:MAG: AAA family ATPase, partial [Cetobacterium sp.]